jgi:hypothetical protein
MEKNKVDINKLRGRLSQVRSKIVELRADLEKKKDSKRVQVLVAFSRDLADWLIPDVNFFYCVCMYHSSCMCQSSTLDANL